MNTFTDNFKNNISRLGYELYKNYRLFEHNRAMLRGCNIHTDKKTFATDLYNHTYTTADKQPVKSYEIFFESAYLDEDFMKELFGTPELIEAYCKSVTAIKEYKDFATYSEDDSIDEFKQRAYNIYHRYYNYDEPYDYFIEFVYPNEEFMRKLLRESTLIDKYLESLKTSEQTDKITAQTTNNIKTDSTDDSVSNIRRLAYELYRIDYQLSVQRDYARYLADNPGTSFDDYITAHGYSDTKIPFQSYDEFIQDAYLNHYYIRNLLNDEDLIDLYRKDIESINDARLPDAESIHELIQTAKTERNN